MNKIKKVLLSLFALFFSFYLQAQNLIMNPGFEDGVMPSSVSEFRPNFVFDWYIGCTGVSLNNTPDLFDANSLACPSGPVGIPSNSKSNNTPTRTANNFRYAGFLGGGSDVSSTFESIKGTLNTPLKSNVLYEISFWARATRFTYCGNLPAHAGNPENKVQVRLYKDNDCSNGFFLFESALIDDSTQWLQFCSSFTLTPTQAAFGYNRVEFRISNNGSYLGKYVFLDDVALVATEIDVVVDRPVICPGEGTEITAEGLYDLTWTPATGLNTTTGNLVVASPATTTTYTVSGTSPCGTIYTKQVTVTVDIPPAITASADVYTCPDQPVTLTVSGTANGYAWDPQTGLNTGFGPLVVANPQSTTTYKVSGQFNGSNCLSHDEVTVFVSSVQISISPIANLCSGGQPVTLSATPSGGYFETEASSPGYISQDGQGNYLFEPFADPGADWIRTIKVYYVYSDPVTGCTFRDSIEIQIFNPPSGTLSISDNCAPANVEIALDGQWGSYPDYFQYEWFKDGALVQSSNSEQYPGAGAGSYIVRVKFPDAPAGCYWEEDFTLDPCCVIDIHNITFNKKFTESFSRSFRTIAIRSLPDGGAIMLGNEKGAPNPDPEEANFFLTRLDKYGDMLWLKRYNFPAMELYATDMLFVDNGYTILCNGDAKEMSSGSPVFTEKNTIVIRTDMDGQVVWEKGHGDQPCQEQIQTQVGLKMVASYNQTGTFDGYFITGYGVRKCTDPFDISGKLFMMKLDPSGNFLWRRFYELPSSSEFTGNVQVHGVGACLSRTSGPSSGSDGYVVLARVASGMTTSQDHADLFVMKISLDGTTVLAQRLFGRAASGSNPNLEYAQAIFQSFDVNDQTDGFVILSSGSSSTFFNKLDVSLNQLWMKEYELPGFNLFAYDALLHRKSSGSPEGYIMAGYHNYTEIQEVGPVSVLRSMALMTDLDGENPIIKSYDSRRFMTSNFNIALGIDHAHLDQSSDMGYYLAYSQHEDKPRVIKTDNQGSSNCTEDVVPDIISYNPVRTLSLVELSNQYPAEINLVVPSVQTRKMNFVCCDQGAWSTHEPYDVNDFDNEVYYPAKCSADFELNFSPVVSSEYDMVLGMSFTPVNLGGATVLGSTWKFHDGSTVTSPTASKFYTLGSYSICMVLYLDNGCIIERCTTINICDFYGNFEIDIVEISDGKMGFTITYEMDPEYIVNIELDYGDGQMDVLTPGDQSQIDHNYSLPGVYRICYNITLANGCVRQICRDITIHPWMILPKTQLNSSSGVNPQKTSGYEEVNEPTGVSNTPGGSRTILLYPNPGSGIYFVDFKTNKPDETTFQMVVYNQFGQKVLIRSVLKTNSVNSIDITNLASGIYEVIITCGGQTYTQRLIKH